ncbi:CLUMA_CG002327, isoform A [Clunio marinus]|uniref:CLUMA_CG002327, isoform A n=1 Tax=Clunio marinus TaxID=568069 RepID=A0A1J1HPT9_9DIPT|nr:CLUMA_CG002327, isoform A [Clunio marinus]
MIDFIKPVHLKHHMKIFLTFNCLTKYAYFASPFDFTAPKLDPFLPCTMECGVKNFVKHHCRVKECNTQTNSNNSNNSQKSFDQIK